jgi:hypothetical protein
MVAEARGRGPTDTGRVRRFRPGRRARLGALLAVVLLLGLASYGGIIAHRARGHAETARADIRRVNDGVDRARAGGVDRATVAGLRDDLTAAESSLAALVGDLDALGPALPLAERLPRIGPRLRADANLVQAALHLVRSGRGFAAVGVAAYDGLEAGNARDRAAFLDALATGTPTLAVAREDYRRGAALLDTVDRSQVEAALRPTLATLDRQFPQLDALISAGADLAPLLPALLGRDRDATYLLLLQDPGELRPTGGFIGNYGLATVRNGAVTATVFQDVYLVDLPYLAARRPLPHPFDRHFPQATAWGLRDSNAWPDFPTSARAAIELAAAEGIAPRVDGVIAITPETVASLLTVLGPVAVPGYDATVDADNVEAQIRRYQYEEVRDNDPRQYEGRDVPYNAARKRFTAALAGEVVARLRDLPTDRLPGLLKAGTGLLDRRAIQLYVADATAQRVLADLRLAGELRVGDGDFLWPIETNLGANKADLYLARDLTYAVTLATDGAATSTLQLGYEFRPTGPLYNYFGYDYFRAYVAIYRAPGAQPVAAPEGIERQQEGEAIAYGQLLEVRPGTSGRIELRFAQPQGARRLPGGEYEYRLRVPRQAGGSWRTHTLAITLPAGAEPIETPPGATVTGQTVLLTTAPRVDLDLRIVYRLP